MTEIESSFGFWTTSDFIKRIRELEAELAGWRKLSTMLTAHPGILGELTARAEKAEARVAELEAERVEEQKRWLLEHETR